MYNIPLESGPRCWLCGGDYGKENWVKVILGQGYNLDPEGQHFTLLPLLGFWILGAQAIRAVAGTGGWPDLRHIPELIVLVQVSKNLRERLTLPLGHQLHEALAGLGDLGFLLY